MDITAPQGRIELRKLNTDHHSTSTATTPPEEEQRHSVVRVFYGHDRTHIVSSREGRTSVSTGIGAPLEFGYCQVRVPDDSDCDESELPAIWRVEFDERSDSGLLLLGIQPVSRQEFASELRSDVNQSGTGEAFVFVHGRQVDFEGAVQQTARIAHGLRFDGPPIVYCWPSETGTGGTLRGQSQTHLVGFLESVLDESGARRVHVIAHSAGTGLAASALDQLARASNPGDPALVSEVILAASGRDAALVQQEIAPRMARVADRVTLYTSDEAPIHLVSSQQPGAGSLNDSGEIPSVPGIDVVDVASQSFGFLNDGLSPVGDHLLNDIRQVIDGVATTQRGLQPHPARNPTWRLPAPDVQLSAHREPLKEGGEQASGEEPTGMSAEESIWSRLLRWRPW